MGKEEDSTRRPLSGWTVNLLRLTLFPAQGFQAAQLNWWEKVLGAPPRTRQSHPAQQIFVDLGEFNRGQLINSNAPNRIDWIYTIAETPSPPAPLASIGPLTDSLSAFVEAMEKWFGLDGSPRASRLALGGTVHLPMPSREEANLQLSVYVPSLRIDDPKENSDISYRINRRRPSRTLPGSMVNRLGTWSVVESFIAEVSPQVLQVQQVGERVTACQVEFDINTDQFFKGVIEVEQLKYVLDELAETARELVSKGDI